MAGQTAQPAERVSSLQVLRFFAALGVVWEHASTRANPHNLTGGSAGVDLFFVLSGFVIARAAATRPAGFLRDRLTRIFPIYWFWALAWLAFATAQGPLSGWRLFTTATLLPAPTAIPLDPYVGVAWTLSFELLFYTAVWLVLRGLSWRLILLAYGALALGALATPSALLHFIGSPMAAEFLLGVLGYRLRRERPLLGALALVTACAIFPFLPKQLSLPQAAFVPVLGLGRVALLGPLAFLVVWGAAQFDCSGSLWRPLVLLGDASYSIYLSHLLLMEVGVRIMGHYVSPAAGTVATITIGLAVYLAVERPLLRLTRQWTFARRALPQPGLA